MTIKEFQGEYRFLSNFHVGKPLLLGTMEFQTAEHLYQALKTNDLAEAQMVAACTTPGEAKRAGQQLTLREDWDRVKDASMRMVVGKKFLGDDRLIQALAATGNVELIEGNKWHDNYWGACYCLKCENKEKKNTLGNILMDLRQDILHWTILN